MKAKLTLVYEKEISSDDIEELKEAVIDYDEQYLSEFFGIGWDGPSDRKIDFDSDH